MFFAVFFLFWKFPVIIAWTFDDCGSNLTEYTGLEQHAGCNRRVQEVVRVKQKKNWNWIVLQRFEPPGFILRRSIEFQWFFAESPCELRFWVVFWHLIGVWVRGFSSALADDFFFRGWPPVVFFLIEKAAAFFFEFRFVAIIKNRPVRGGFLLQLNLCGPNSTLCRWYRTFFEILFQKCVVPDLFEILRRVPAW